MRKTILVIVVGLILIGVVAVALVILIANYGAKKEGWQSHFLSVTEAGTQVTVQDGEEYTIRLSTKNDSADATGVGLAISIPQEAKTEVKVVGLLYADGLENGRIWDEVMFTGEKPFHLEYVYGSAETGGTSVDDSVVTRASQGGQTVGALKKGKIAEITIKVRAVIEPEFKLTAQVRPEGEKAWTDSVKVKAGDRIEIQIEYANTDETEKTETAGLLAALPEGLQFVPGSVKIWNTSKSGSAAEDSLVTTGLGLGTYAPGANAFVRFTAVVTATGEMDFMAQCQVGKLAKQAKVIIIAE